MKKFLKTNWKNLIDTLTITIMLLFTSSDIVIYLYEIAYKQNYDLLKDKYYPGYVSYAFIVSGALLVMLIKVIKKIIKKTKEEKKQ